MTTGEIIQAKRKQYGWSQDQLAEKLGISRQSISKWEQDSAMPDLENGLKLCETLGITVEELLHPKSFQKPVEIQSSENAFQSAEKFVKKTWHFAGIYVAVIGFFMIVSGSIFKILTQAMDKQAQTSLDSMFGGFGGMFQNVQTASIFSPFIGLFINAGVIVMLAGIGIFAYGRYRRQHA